MQGERRRRATPEEHLQPDNKFHDIGVGVQSGKINDSGLYEVTHIEADRGKFKTPSLRNIALTAPYMHDGSLRDSRFARWIFSQVGSAGTF